ncbi:MAG: hypothetical protein P9X24_12550 [Candidatus Hatepunaea meridiana]|nr:hypothetical protein [Candidatus Hatepunaea meridiana]
MLDNTKLLLPQYLINLSGERVGVFLDIETYQRIMEELEDKRDNLLMDEVENDERIPLEEALREEDERRGKIVPG